MIVCTRNTDDVPVTIGYCLSNKNFTKNEFRDEFAGQSKEKWRANDSPSLLQRREINDIGIWQT